MLLNKRKSKAINLFTELVKWEVKHEKIIRRAENIATMFFFCAIIGYVKSKSVLYSALKS